QCSSPAAERVAGVDGPLLPGGSAGHHAIGDGALSTAREGAGSRPFNSRSHVPASRSLGEARRNIRTLRAGAAPLRIFSTKVAARRWFGVLHSNRPAAAWPPGS